MSIKLDNQFYYRITKGDTILKICEKFNTSKENIVRNNFDLDLYDGEWILIKQNDYIVHIVKPAETLFSIANIYKIPTEKIKNDNNLKNDKLYIGQHLKICK